MNRDEKRTRAKGLPPAKKKIGGRQVIYPSEPNGGTWIALNDHGAMLALINWYSVTARVTGVSISRGDIIPSMSTAQTPVIVDAHLAALPLDRTNPFRLIGVFPASQEINEWRWDLKQLTRRDHRWRGQQWISSGFDEPTAQKVRSRTFRRFQTQASVGTTGWLRRLHLSHNPQQGPFSTCMHRDDAATVSYTEITVSRGRATLQHLSGTPCETSKVSSDGTGKSFALLLNRNRQVLDRVE